jgi:hypothetical protein
VQYCGNIYKQPVLRPDIFNVDQKALEIESKITLTRRLMHGISQTVRQSSAAASAISIKHTFEPFEKQGMLDQMITSYISDL